ncbi:MAG: NrtA/SsuA/CpmA family ABC transporter substrate-binding protein [Gallionella sp.]|nr:NrtA/SsuA/CpmA family ABC transporter substrate-binding protein [Gallionella sp.]MDD4959598.1 NrtA/SsuA/CpmA family ABC transporter substrate-binding protein [Gallionella sp.]
MIKQSLVFMCFAVLIGCQKPPTLSAESAQKITVAYTYQPQSTLVHIAMKNGYFAEEGLDAQPLMHTYGKAALQSVLDNQADFATVAETPVMFSVLKGEKIFVLANIEASTMNNAVVARKDAGIHTSLDLKGKRIGFTLGTTSDFFLDSLLTANGITRKEIQPIPLKPEEMQAAILSKRVDAVSTWNYPLTLIKQQLQANATVIFDQEIYTETFNIAAKQDFVHKNPETVRRFLRALIKAEQFVANNPERAQAIMSAETQIAHSLIHEVWNAFNYRVVLDKTLLITLEDEARWAIKNKLVDQTIMPDFMNFIYVDSLKAIKPEAVKISH